MLQRYFTAILLMAGTLTISAQIGLVQQDVSFDPLVLEIEDANGDFEIIDWGQPVDFGPNFRDSLTAEIEWLRGSDGDSLSCIPSTQNLDGKWALIRRGICNFSLKAYHAVQAGAVGYLICNDDRFGAENQVFGMTGGDSLTAVTIPGAFVPKGYCDRLVAKIDNGETAQVRMRRISFWEASVFHYPKVPVSQVSTAFTGPAINFFNYEKSDSVLTTTLSVTTPDGMTSVLGTVTDTVTPNTFEAIQFDGVEILPNQGVGSYVYTFSSDLPTANDYSYTVEVTDNLFQSSEDIAGAQPSRTLQLSDAGYSDAGESIGWGIVVEAVEDFEVGTVQFSICNSDTLTDLAVKDVIVELSIFDLDADRDGVYDFPGVTNTNDFNFDNEIGFNEYEIDGSERCTSNPDDLVSLSPEDPTILEAGSAYMIQLVAVSDGIGGAVSPAVQAGVGTGATNWYGGANRAFSKFWRTTDFFAGFVSFGDDADDPRFAYQTTTPYIRVTSEVISDVQEELQAELTLSPNPASDVAVLQYNFSQAYDDVELVLVSPLGQIVNQTVLASGQQSGVETLALQQYPAGAYSLQIRAGGKVKTLKLNIVR